MLLRQVGTVHKRRRSRQWSHRRRRSHRAPLGVRPPLRLRRRALRSALRRMQRRAESVSTTRAARAAHAARAAGWDRRTAAYCLRRARLGVWIARNKTRYVVGCALSSTYARIARAPVAALCV